MLVRGSSGASITMNYDHVSKDDYINDRVHLQGEWLRDHPYTVLPEVYEVNTYGYRMERLCTAPAWALDHMEVLHGLLDGMQQVWSQDPVVKVDVRTTLRKVTDIVQKHLPDSEVSELLTDVAFELNWDDLRACLTHGDMTFDNVMFRDDQLVVIDPIPATITTGVPDLWSADMGHILRSVLGFERVRYQDEAQRFRVTPAQLRFHVLDDMEWTATVFWASVHLLRTLPYAPNDEIREMLGELVNDAIGLF